MILPLGSFAQDLSLQRRIDAIECLNLEYLTTSEVERVERGLLKYNIMWWGNRLGLVPWFLIMFRGKLLDRGKNHSLSLLRSGSMAFFIFQYLYIGDYLASSVLWEEFKFTFYKYEPHIRQKRIGRNPSFLHE